MEKAFRHLVALLGVVDYGIVVANCIAKQMPIH
jgi:hypothetical protein